MDCTQADVERVMDVVRVAAEMVLNMQRAGLRQVRSKSSQSDLVTEADIASEKLIRNTLAVAYPGVPVWGEETNQIPDTEYFWLVDPIDGTNNYAMGIDYCAVTVALQRGETTLLGVTQQIHTGRVYHARLGAGAFRREPGGEEVRLQVNTADQLGTSLLATGFPYHRAEHSDNNAAEFAYFMPRVVGLRVLGAAALDMAYVASGALAAFWEGWLGPWDAAAGALLVREAGGRVTTYTGEEWTIRRGDLVASNGQAALHQAMLEGIRDARKGEIGEGRVRG